MDKTVWTNEGKAGLVIGNATMSADVTKSGRMYGRIVYNPPCFEEWSNGLREAGEGGFHFTVDGKTAKDCDLSWDVIEKAYPRYRASADVSCGVKVSVLAFSPLTIGDPDSIFTPCSVTELTFTNSSDSAKSVAAAFEWHTTEDALRGSFGKELLLEGNDGLFTLTKGDAFMAAFDAESGEMALPPENFALSAGVTVPAGKAKKIVFLHGIFEKNHRFATKFALPREVCAYVKNSYASIRAGIDEFVDCVPNVGDEKIYLYTRWYMQAAILLTKSAKTGEVITMGYTELNQRDSFWTSFVHVSLWSTLERDIIRLSARWMRPDGKIPTTILPRIERDFDIDINQYFCLRIARYFRYHRDVNFLEEMYDYFLKSVDFTLSMDRDGDFIPEQDVPENDQCFWADWKDVLGIIGRKLAPHFALLQLAVYKEGSFLAEAMGDGENKARFEKMYDVAFDVINRDVKDGGLWAGDHYAETWYDGREMTEVLQDQTVGLVWGVVPEERIGKIYEALTRGENDFGIRETYPYREVFNYPGADYHNGGIWPYLMFCDIMSRYSTGYAGDAERLIKKVGYYDLEVPGDFAPNEFLNGDTGENCGKEIQGWSSALYGSLTHGAFKISHNSESELTVKVNFKERDFETKLVLPKKYGKVTLSRKDGVLSCSEPVRSGLKINVVER